jgi:hypothetical protein
MTTSITRISLFFINDGATRGARAAQELALRERLRYAGDASTPGTSNFSSLQTYNKNVFSGKNRRFILLTRKSTAAEIQWRP